ncbi:MAG: matrixin family metalloprotease, partial [bacterium]|nr:matrixin family metalloprotease [bacterium]
YARLKSEYAALKNVYDTQAALLDGKTAAYESNVRAWNESDRTSRSQFEALETERLALERELAQVKVIEGGLNRKVQELNALVGRLNRLARSLNLNVEEYNTVGASRGETFAGGIYSESSEGQKIDIYEFESREKLVRILAHELGHALGLGHIDDPKAIMYELNESDAGIATASDLAALNALCVADK